MVYNILPGDMQHSLQTNNDLVDKVKRIRFAPFIQLCSAFKELFIEKLPFTCFMRPFLWRILPVNKLIDLVVLIIYFFPGFSKLLEPTYICKVLKDLSLGESLLIRHKTNLTGESTMIQCETLQVWLHCSPLRFIKLASCFQWWFNSPWGCSLGRTLL